MINFGKVQLIGHINAAILIAMMLLATTACGTMAPNANEAALSEASTISTVTNRDLASPRTTAGSRIVAHCQAKQLVLGLDRYQSGSGAGHQWTPWSITNVSNTPCVVDGGVPTLTIDNARGQAAVASRTEPFQRGPLAVVSTVPLTLRSGGTIWFFTDSLSGCNQPYQTLSGGPFSDVVTLPGSHIQLHWSGSGSYLAQPTLPVMCPTFRAAVSGLQTTELTEESEQESPATPVATP